MRISKVEAMQLRRQGAIDTAVAHGSQDRILVRVHTDEGIIDAPPSHKVRSGLGTFLVRENPLDIGRLWQKMYQGSLYLGRRGAAIHAISGVEIALWDIAGKAAGKLVHALLGGAWRDRVKAYASTLMSETPDEAARVVEDQLDAGFRGEKLGWGPLGRSADLDVARVAAARKAGGERLDLIIGIGKGWRSERERIDRIRRIEEYRPYWIEESFCPDDYAKYAALAATVSTPIAAGEEETTLADFERLVEKGECRGLTARRDQRKRH
jgi:L-rhamnonate dehydratase